MKKKKLTPKQRLFCKEYMVDLNATQAAIRAGYSKKTARQLGAQLLSNINIQHFLQNCKDKREAKVELTAEQILADMKLLNDICLGRIEIITGQEVKGKMVKEKKLVFDGKTAATIQEKLGRHLGIFEKDNQQKQQPMNMVLNIGGKK